MNELQRIQDQIARSLNGEAWHGPALMEGLSGVDARAAMARPIPNAHTIWEIVRHVSASADLVLARLRGEARTLSPEELSITHISTEAEKRGRMISNQDSVGGM